MANASETGILPARSEREQIYGKDAYNERACDTLGFCGSEDCQCVRVRGDQTIAFYRHPLIGKGCAVSCNPSHLLGAVPVRNPHDVTLPLKIIGEAQNLLLFRLGQVADFVEDGFFQTHGRLFSMISEPTSN